MKWILDWAIQTCFLIQVLTTGLPLAAIEQLLDYNLVIQTHMRVTVIYSVIHVIETIILMNS